MNPFFSIITPVFNGSVFISDYISCLISQKFTNWEAIVVDDGSSDDTLNLLKRHTSGDLRFRIFSLPSFPFCKNTGPARPRNFALKQVVASYVCFLDIDDFWLEYKLMHQYEFICRRPDVKLFYSDYYKCNFTLSRGYIKPRLDFLPIKVQIYLFNPIPMLTSCVKTELVRDYNFRDIGHEDYIFWFDIISDLLEYEIAKVCSISSLYRLSSNSLSCNKFKLFSWWINCYRLVGHNKFLSYILPAFRFLLEIVEIFLVLICIIPIHKLNIRIR